jgi:exodeoxyribonuclease (lambda-induced)
MKIYKDLVQGSEEWLNVRKGKMTASHGQEIGNNGKGLDSYILAICAEKNSSGEVDFYSNKDMDRGNELEDSAVSIFELENGVDVERVGFIEYNEYVGCSPDGLIDEDGGIEVKCPNDLNYFKILVGGEKEIDSKYLWQIQMNLLITERKYWKLVYYNPNYTKSMIVFHILPDLEKQEQLKKGFELGQAKIEEIQNKLTHK